MKTENFQVGFFLEARRQQLGCFPLTLTLSPGEREQPFYKFVKLERNRAEVSGGLALARRTFLPLPGERAGVREDETPKILIVGKLQ